MYNARVGKLELWIHWVDNDERRRVYQVGVRVKSRPERVIGFRGTGGEKLKGEVTGHSSVVKENVDRALNIGINNGWVRSEGNRRRQ